MAEGFPDDQLQEAATTQVDQLVPPADTLRRVDELLNTPDDSGRFLPKVHILRNIDGGDDGARRPIQWQVYADKEQVGHAIVEQLGSGDEMALRDIEVRGGGGRGYAAYLRLVQDTLQKNADFRSSIEQVSPQAAAVWRRLASDGVATVVQEFEPIDPSRADSPLKGYYVVNGNNKPKTSFASGDEHIQVA